MQKNVFIHEIVCDVLIYFGVQINEFQFKEQGTMYKDHEMVSDLTTAHFKQKEY